MIVGPSGTGSYGNSKLFSANLWHYIGGKEAADDPFAEHTASIHRPPFSAHKFSDGTLGMRSDGTLDLPDVVIPSGRRFTHIFLKAAFFTPISSKSLIK